MTPKECYFHYLETGDRQFYSIIYDLKDNEIRLKGEIPLCFGQPMLFRSDDCIKMELDSDELDWYPW